MIEVDIKKRILNRIESTWPSTDGLNEPLVNMLLSACTSELASIYHDIENSDQRIVERMVNLLIPSWKVYPFPSHGIVFSNAKTAYAKFNPHEICFTVGNDNPHIKSDPIHISPAVTTAVVKMSVQTIVSDNNTAFQPDLQRYIDLQHGKALKPVDCPDIETRFLVIFLQFENKINSLEDVSVYFDLPVRDDKSAEQSSVVSDNAFLQELSKAEWRLNDVKIDITKGLPEDNYGINKEYNPVSLIEQQISERYRNNFITFSKNAILHSSSHISLPEDLNYEQLRLNYLKELAPNPAVLTIHFKEPVKISNDLFISFNCFPVMNRRLEEKGLWYRHDGILPVQVKSDNTFLGIDSIFDSALEEEPFVLSPLTSFKETEECKYTLVERGIGRMDEFNFWQRYKSIIGEIQKNYTKPELLEMLDMMSIEELQEIFDEKNMLQDAKLSDSCAYVLLQKSKDTKIIHLKIRYWGTLGALPLGIKQNSKLEFVENSAMPELDKDANYLIKPLSGGKDAPTQLAGIKELKDTLLQNNQIVTIADIEKYCYIKYKDQIKDIEITEGSAINPLGKTGIRRVIEVLINFNKDVEDNHEYALKSLEYELNELSSSIIPILVKPKQ